MAGEVAHHLRSALDLLVYQLLLSINVTDPKRLETCAFPMVTRPDLSTTKRRKDHDGAIEATTKMVHRGGTEARIGAIYAHTPQAHWTRSTESDPAECFRKHVSAIAAIS
jgi:hypothetical protein